MKSCHFSSDGVDWKKKLWNLIEANKNSHFFFDEVPYGGNSGLKTNEFQNLSNLVSNDCCLWIAFQSDTTPNQKSLEKNSKKYIIYK